MVKKFSKLLKFKNKTNNNYADNKRWSRKRDYLDPTLMKDYLVPF